MADKRLLLALFLIAPALVWSVPRLSWFKVDGPVGSTQRSFLVTMATDSIPVFIGNQRKASAHVPGQTFPALQVSLEARYQGKDTAFYWNSVMLFKSSKAVPLPEPVWNSVIRGGVAENEWSRIQFQARLPKVDFHSPIYGDGEHPLESGVLPEESIFLLASKIAMGGEETHFKVMASAWEQSYTRKTYMMKAFRTEQRLKIDDVEALLVRFERDDGADAEFWVSTGGYRILRGRTFRGLLFERIQ